MAEATPDVSHLLDAAPEDVQATFCATLVDQWIERGVRHAVVAPGSRSTPLALAVSDRPELQVHVVHDERVAAFVALGLGVDTDVPALVMCTSGTAAANFLPAVAEANLSGVPMLLLTADRPSELRGVGAPQTIDQLELYGTHARWFHDPDVPEAASAGAWRPLADTAFDRAGDGPVHLNLPFREPLVGRARALPDADTSAFSDDPPARDVDDPVPDSFDVQRGVILAGGRSGVARADVIALHERTEWPIIADPQSGLRGHPDVIVTADALLRHERFADDHVPTLVVRVGRPSASKLLARWSARCETLIQVGGPGVIDPEHNVTARCSIESLLAAEPVGASGTTWLRRWRHADRLANQVLADGLAGEELGEAAVARLVAEHRPDRGRITVSSSMPVRDLEWFGGHEARAHANRGANGIDGVLSTALGRTLADRTPLDDPDRSSEPGDAAPSERPGVVLIGDLAFVHDSNALVALAQRHVDLRVVVVDNDGGGIFSFLPQSARLDPERFEHLFGTPLGVDVLGLARACGVDAVEIGSRSELVDQLGRRGPWVARVATDRRANVHDHRRLDDLVRRALDV